MCQLIGVPPCIQPENSQTCECNSSHMQEDVTLLTCSLFPSGGATRGTGAATSVPHGVQAHPCAPKRPVDEPSDAPTPEWCAYQIHLYLLHTYIATRTIHRSCSYTITAVNFLPPVALLPFPHVLGPDPDLTQDRGSSPQITVFPDGCANCKVSSAPSGS